MKIKRINNFDTLFIDIIRQTIKLDSTFNVVLKLYYESGNDNFEKDILKNNKFELSQKGDLVYTIAKRLLPTNRCKGLKDKIYRCAEIRNIIAHEEAIKEGWNKVSYFIQPKKKKGIKEKKMIQEIWQEYLENFTHIYKVCFDLTREIRANKLIENLRKVYVNMVETKKGYSIMEISLVNSTNKRVTVFHWLQSEYSKYNVIKIEQDIRYYLEKNKSLRNKEYSVVVQKLEPPEQEDPPCE